MDKLLAAQFFFDDPTTSPTTIRIGANGNLSIVGGGATKNFSRFVLYFGGELHFWTHCLSVHSVFEVKGKTLTIDYSVRNALFEGLKYKTMDSAADLRFKMRAAVDGIKGVQVLSLEVGRRTESGDIDKFSGYNPWKELVEVPHEEKFYWDDATAVPARRCDIPLFAALGARDVSIERNPGYGLPLAIGRVSHPSRNQYRIEIRLGLNDRTVLKSGKWPEAKVDRLTFLSGPRLRLPAEKTSTLPLEYGVSLEFDTPKHAYVFAQTDPWDPPADKDREVWREFRIDGLSPSRALEGFQRVLSKPVQLAISLANEADGISLLPQLETDGANNAVTVTIAWEQHDKKPSSVLWNAEDFGRVRGVRVMPTKPFPVRVTLPGLASLQGGVRFNADCQFFDLDSEKSKKAELRDVPAYAEIRLSTSKQFEQRDIDVGAMRLTTDGASLTEFVLVWGLALDRYRPLMQRPAFFLNSKFGKILAQPAGFDPDPVSRFSDDANSDLLQTPIVYADDRAAIRSVFAATERLRDDHSRSLELTLAAQPPDRAAGAQQQKDPSVELIVLDPTPFFIGKIEFRLPTANNDAGNTYATWKLSDPEGPRWRFKSLQPEMTLTLPTQGVGEAYERRKDISERKDIPEREGTPDPPAGGIDYRLGPHAVFHLRLRDDERAYSDLPWNLRLLFGRPGEAVAGPRLTSAHFELLYGLESILRPAGVHLATDETQRGRIPQSFLGERDAGSDQAKWNRLVAGYQSRLLSLQPYRPLEAGPLRFDQDSGLRQHLRLAKASASEASSSEDPRKECADLHAKPYLAKTGNDPDHGLRGGATFGFESQRIYEAVTRDLQSTSGEMSRVAWTALGGYGALKARFDEDRSIIEANVEQGRVSHYAVERIGRIGVFWNRAKHVIVYERTTQRADRYASGDEQQSELAHLPIVRKIDEYIEILEPERRFAPAGRPAQSTGFVQGLKFADRIIRVSSLWGRDVGEVGWSVPLWRQDALAKTFPKPLVNLIAASEEAGEDALHAIADPEHLVFFTNIVRDAGSDTDRWPAVESVDFVDASLRVDGTEAAFGDRSAATLSKPLPAPTEAPALLAACTWRIEDGERPIDLIAGRGPQPISAKLRNLTVMRKPAGLVGELSETQQARALLADFDDLRRDVRDTARNGLLAGWDEARWKMEKARLEKRIGALGKGLDAGIDELFRSSPCELLTKQALRPLNALLSDVGSRIDEESARVQREALALQNIVKTDIERLAGEFLRRIDALAASGSLAKAQSDDTLIQLRGDLDRIREQALVAVEQANAELQGLLVGIESDFDLSIFRLRIVRAQQAMSAVRQKLLSALDDLQCACARLAARWNGEKGDKTLAERLQILIEDVKKKIFEESIPTADKALQELAQEVTVVAGDFSRIISEVLEHVKDTRIAIVGAVQRVCDILGNGIDKFNALSSETFSVFSNVIVKLREDIVSARETFDDAADAGQFVAAVDTVKNALKGSIDSAFKDAEKIIAGFIKNKVCDFLPDIDATRIKALRNLLDEAANLVAAFGQSGLAAAQKVFDGKWTGLSRALDEASDWVNHVVDSLGETVRTAVDAPLSLLRAFGAAPALPSLSFNREWLEYVFDPSDLTIDISPVTSFFAELGDDLKGLSLNLPSIGIDASGLLPAALRDFDLNAVFGSLGGVKMPGLLSRVKLPNLDRNAVRLTHGFDKKTKRAWVQADVDVPYGANPALFEAMSLALRLVKPKFTARSRMEAGLEGKPAFYAKGEIASTVRLEFSGNPLVDLRDAAIRFDDRGQFDFDFSPDRIDFKAGLKFLTDLIRARSKLEQDPEQARGFVPALIEADGVPIGVRTTLELDPGPLNFGAFSIDGLALNLSFELVAKPEFKVGTRISLASPDKPFVLSVGLLGGGGWLAASASYLPSKGLIESEVDIAIAAGRLFSVNFGPIRGMAQVVFGINAKFVSSGSRSRLSLIVFFLFSGNFRLWGIVTVGVYLRLEIEYQSTGSLVGRGVVHVTVKIGRFFKRTVRQRVNYRFAGNANNRAALTDQGRAVAPAAMMTAGATPQPTVNYPDRAAAYLARYEE